MKARGFGKFAAALAAAFSLGGQAQAAAFDPVLQQVDAGGFSILTRILAQPGSNCVIYFDAGTLLPACATLSGGLVASGGVIDGSGAGTPATWTTLTGKPSWTGVFDGSWSTIASKPTTLSGYGITDAYPLTGNPSGFLTGITSGQVTAALGFTPYNAANPAAYVSQSGARAAISLTTTGTGAATYDSSSGVLNVPTPASATPFSFGLPAAKTVVVSTDYQAADPSKNAVVTITASCSNNSTLVAANPCTLQFRMGASSLTCSTGTVYSTISATVALGLVITQSNTTPAQLALPAGAHFIACPVAGTWTLTAVEQTAGN